MKSFDFKFTSHREECVEEMERMREAALEAIGSKVAGYAIPLAPVDTGLLKNSITWALDGEQPKIKTYHAQYGSNRDKDGKRISAAKKGAGAVNFGCYEGTAPKDPSGSRSVTIGTNVEYAA